MAEQDEAAMGTDFALPGEVSMCGLCRIPVYFKHHDSGGVHQHKLKKKAAAAWGHGRGLKLGHLSHSRLLALCRWQCVQN